MWEKELFFRPFVFIFKDFGLRYIATINKRNMVNFPSIQCQNSRGKGKSPSSRTVWSIFYPLSKVSPHVDANSRFISPTKSRKLVRNIKNHTLTVIFLLRRRSSNPGSALGTPSCKLITFLICRPVNSVLSYSGCPCTTPLEQNQASTDLYISSARSRRVRAKGGRLRSNWSQGHISRSLFDGRDSIVEKGETLIYFSKLLKSISMWMALRKLNIYIKHFLKSQKAQNYHIPTKNYLLFGDRDRRKERGRRVVSFGGLLGHLEKLTINRTQ